MAWKVAFLTIFVTATFSSFGWGQVHPRMIIPYGGFGPGMFNDLLTDLPPEVRDLVLKEAMDEDPRLPYMREKCIEVFGADPHHLPPTNRHRIKPGQGHGEMTVGSLGDDDEDFRKNPNRRQDSEFFAGVARELRERCGALKDDHPPRIHEDDLELAQLHELYVSTLDAESRLQEARVWADLEILHAQRVRLMLERMGPT